MPIMVFSAMSVLPTTVWQPKTHGMNLHSFSANICKNLSNQKNVRVTFKTDVQLQEFEPTFSGWVAPMIGFIDNRDRRLDLPLDI